MMREDNIIDLTRKLGKLKINQLDSKESIVLESTIDGAIEDINKHIGTLRLIEEELVSKKESIITERQKRESSNDN